MRVHALYLYPVKSLAGIAVSGFKLDSFGPHGDRRWMIVDADDRFVTQREAPELARIATTLNADCVAVEIPQAGHHELAATDTEITASVWRDQVTARLGDSAANQALSRFCGRPLRFVYMPDATFRRVDPQRVATRRRVGFADGFPLLITNQASLEDLNARLETPVPMRRFRPNIVVAGAAPWAEDDWRLIEIGTLAVDIVKPCGRCVVTTVDPDTGIKDRALQPLRTLSGFRRQSGGVIFGQNGVHQAEGSIRIGDAVNPAPPH